MYFVHVTPVLKYYSPPHLLIFPSLHIYLLIFPYFVQIRRCSCAVRRCQTTNWNRQHRRPLSTWSRYTSTPTSDRPSTPNSSSTSCRPTPGPPFRDWSSSSRSTAPSTCALRQKCPPPSSRERRSTVSNTSSLLWTNLHSDLHITLRNNVLQLCSVKNGHLMHYLVKKCRPIFIRWSKLL